MPNVDYSRAMASLLGVNLGVKSGERVLVFTDIIAGGEKLSDAESSRRLRLPELARQLAGVAERDFETVYHEYPSVGRHGKEPPESLWRAALGDALVGELKSGGLLERLLRKEASEEEFQKAADLVSASASGVVDCVVALSNFSSTHTRFCQLITGAAGGRYASMPMFDEKMFAGPLFVDARKLSDFTLKVREAFDGASTAIIRTPEGTELFMETGGALVKADTGLLDTPGKKGNLPAGEVFLAPLQGTARGRMRIYWGPSGKLDRPLTLTIEQGMCVAVDGEDKYKDFLLNLFKKFPLAANVAELGVGTNERASRPDNVLEAEKILGTVHIALGDNSTFGGAVSVPFHQDFILFNPTLSLARESGEEFALLKDGKINLPNH
jgi:aminopeptidase